MEVQKVERPSAPVKRSRKSAIYPYDEVRATLEDGGAVRFSVPGDKDRSKVISTMKSSFKRQGFQMEASLVGESQVDAWIEKKVEPRAARKKKETPAVEAATAA